MLWSVQMNRRHKASVICILGLGVFATAAALVKLSYLPSYGHSGDCKFFLKPKDTKF